MKRFINIFSAVALLTAMSACQAELPPIVINPDPVFDKNGAYTLNTISIYEEEEVLITVSRVHGLSKEVDMIVDVDAALLEEYNTLNGTSYKLMPEEYYDHVASVRLDKTVKSIEVPVTLKPKALVEAFGIEASQEYVLPISITNSSITLDDKGAMAQVIILPHIVEPQLNVTLPEVNAELDFIRGNPIDQSIVLTAESNFNTIKADKVTYVPVPEAVASYNEKNGTSYELLPAEYYSVADGVLDLETMTYATNVTFSCHEIESEGNSYILPLTMKSDDYTVKQNAPLYVIVELTELRVEISDGGSMVKKYGNVGEITFSLNAPLASDFNINLIYDEAMVEAYNQANGTSFMAVDPAKLTITSSVIQSGAYSATVRYEVEWSEFPYDNGQTMLLPLTIDESVLMEGTRIEGGKTVYLELVKTLAGIWDVDPIVPMYPAGVQNSWKALVGPTIWLADGTTVTNNKTQKPSGHGHKYCFVYGGENYWVDGVLYFDIDFENEMPDMPGCYPIINFRDRPGGYDKVENYNSYFDMTKEEFHFDITILAYSAPGGGRGDALQAPDHVPGWAKYGRMYNRH